MFSVNSKGKLKTNKEAYLFTLPANILLGIVVIFPILYSFYLSFCNMSLNHFYNFHFIGLRQYEKVFSLTDSDFIMILIRTCLWTIINMVLIVVIAFFIALALNVKDLKFKGIYRTILILPWAIPSYISALVWKGMFNYDFGIINAFLKCIGIGKTDWLDNPVTAFGACILVNVWMSVPFMMIITLGGLQSIDENIYEAAQIDGANWWQRTFHLTIPLLKPVLFPAIVLTSYVTFKQFDIIYLMTKGLSGQTDLILTYAYNTYQGYNYSLSAAFSMIIFAILIIMTVINMRLTKKGDSIV